MRNTLDSKGAKRQKRGWKVKGGCGKGLEEHSVAGLIVSFLQERCHAMLDKQNAVQLQKPSSTVY